MRIFSNLALSVDGRIADRLHPKVPLGSVYDRQLMQKIRRQSDAILVGAETLRVSGHSMRAKGAKKNPINVVVTQSGIIPSHLKFWKDDSVMRLLFTTPSGFKNANKSAKDRAFVYVSPGPKLKMSWVVSELKKLGVNNLLVEGGGRIIGQMLEEKLLNEMYLTLTPRILGGRQNPLLVSLEHTLKPWALLSLKSFRKRKNEFYFHYLIKGRKHV